MGSQAADPSGRRPFGASDLAPPTERERLLEAMAASCAKRGYGSTTMAAVAAEAGVSQEGFERHFGDKAGCALAALNQILAEITQAAASSTSPELADWQKLIGGMRALLELLAARPLAAQLACTEARHGMPKEGYAAYASGIRVLTAMLDRVRAYAALTGPASATRGAIGSVEILIRRELAAGRAERLPQLLPDIIYGTVVPFLDQREALHYAELAREAVNEGG